MITGGTGGGNTITGLQFENKVDLLTLLQRTHGYEVRKSTSHVGDEVFFNDQLVARCFRKHDFYKFLEAEGVKWKVNIKKITT